MANLHERDQTYLTALSLLLGVTILKLTELFQLGDELKKLLDVLKEGFSWAVVCVYVFVSGYLIFFVLVTLASYSVVRQLASDTNEIEPIDNGPLVAMCLGVLAVSYLAIFVIVIYTRLS